jgi:hypothetical protein
VIATLTVLAVTLGFVALLNALAAQQSATHVSQAQTADAKKIAQLAQHQAQEATDQLRRDAALLCGGFVPIARAPLMASTSPLGQTIVTWARTGAATLNCPGR